MELSTEHELTGAFLDSKSRLARHAVYRAFAEETVVLNLKTGKYHGLNRTAGRMLEVLEQSPTVRDAVERLAREYDVAAAEVERDVTELCGKLLRRGLIELANADTG